MIIHRPAVPDEAGRARDGDAADRLESCQRRNQPADQAGDRRLEHVAAERHEPCRQSVRAGSVRRAGVAASLGADVAVIPLPDQNDRRADRSEQIRRKHDQRDPENLHDNPSVRGPKLLQKLYVIIIADGSGIVKNHLRSILCNMSNIKHPAANHAAG